MITKSGYGADAVRQQLFNGKVEYRSARDDFGTGDVRLRSDSLVFSKLRGFTVFIVLVWDDDYIAQFSAPSPAQAVSKATDLLKEGRQNIFVRDPDRNEYRAEEFRSTAFSALRKAG